MTNALTNQRRVFKACLTQTERVSDDVSRKIGPLDFTNWQLLSKRQIKSEIVSKFVAFLENLDFTECSFINDFTSFLLLAPRAAS